MSVVPLHPCRRCGASDAHAREVFFRQKRVLRFWSCDRCWDEVGYTLAKDREIVEILIAIGVDRHVVNMMMIAKMATEEARKPR